jgi:hypothetical protein
LAKNPIGDAPEILPLAHSFETNTPYDEGLLYSMAAERIRKSFSQESFLKHIGMMLKDIP